ncbi:MAG: ABC transporter substrate-binding protein [Chloroflexi bacterium]|nr:ABC transporter substrate-binding protein [Chloroflexota bacterium]
MQKGLRIRLFCIGLALLVIVAFALACGSAPDDGDAAAPAQPVATPTFPPTPIPPAIAQPTAAPAAAAAAPAAMSSDGIQTGGHLRVLNDGFPPKWDFTQTSTWISLFHYGGRAYSGLLQFSPRDGVEIWPDMADSWEVMDNNQTYVFHINENLTEYHDGEPFTLDDVVYAIDRWRDPPEGIIQPRVGAFNLIDTMEVVDDRTLEIKLKEPFGDFIAEAANQWHMFIPRHILEANDNTITSFEQLVGTGPYKIVDAEDGISVEMEKDANYFRSDPDGNPYPYLDKVTSVVIAEPQAIIAALNAKRASATKPNWVGVSHLEYKQMAEEGDGTFLAEAFATVDSVQLNNEAPPFDNIDARRAIMYGFNKNRIIEIDGAENPIFPISWFSYLHPSPAEIAELPGYNPAKRDEEVAMAREFAESAGLTEFDLIWIPTRVAHAEQLQQDLLECCDVQVNIVIQDWTAMIAAVEGRRYEAAIGGTAPSYAGTVPIIDIMYSEGGGRNGGWDPPDEWEAAWNKARTQQPGADQDALFDEMHRIMLEEWVPMVPVYANNHNKFHWNYVHNWQLVAQDIFSNNKFEDVWIDCNAPSPGPGC